MTHSKPLRVRINHDLHVHTFLSSCSKDKQAVPPAIIERAQTQNLEIIGFADHLWDATVDGASSWYASQDTAHLLQIKEQIPTDPHGIKILVGCETEYRGNGRIGISRATAEQLDFVLVPFTHFHMGAYMATPEEVATADAIAKTTVRRFQEVLTLGLATGLAHPFMLCGYKERSDDILGRISDAAFADCFGQAAQQGVSIEIHPGYFPSLRGPICEGYHDETFLRILSIAKQCGCRFHFASDTHTLDGIGSVHQLAPYLAELGITNEDILPSLRTTHFL